MKENCQEVKTSLYAGMSIFNLIKDVNIMCERRLVDFNEKKYLSLYLGILNTDNIVSTYLKSKDVNIGVFFNFKDLDHEEYLYIYNTYFVHIFDEISFESITDNLKYLLNKKIIKMFNKSNGYDIESLFIDSNTKQYVNLLKCVE